MKRRSFLLLGGGAVAAGAVGGYALSRRSSSLPPMTHTTSQPANQPTNQPASEPTSPPGSQPAASRTLVVVDLQGGNDALNTLVPQSGLYHDLRPSIALPESDLLTFTGLDYGVNPALAALEPLWNQGSVAALYGTGLPGQGRSHFVAQDAWRTARPGEPARSGWLGRWLEATSAPAPSELRAIALGQSSLAAKGELGRPVSIQSVEGFQLKPPSGNSAVTAAVRAMTDPSVDGLLAQAHAAFPATLDAVAQLQTLVAGVEINEDESLDVDGDRALFQAAQAIIQGDVGAQVLYVTIAGFDTHSLQGAKQDALLQLVSEGLAELFANLELSGHAENTLALVVSEFGRRVAENGSLGTDHGQGGLSFLVGPPVAESTLIGAPDLSDLEDNGLRIDIDARTLYDHALRWLGASDAVVIDVLGAEWNELNLLT